MNFNLQELLEEYMGFNPDKANKNMLGGAYSEMGRNSTATNFKNAQTGAATMQPNSLMGLAGKQVGMAGADWAKRLLTNTVGYAAPGSTMPITPIAGVAKDALSVVPVGSKAFDPSMLMPSGPDLATAGLGTLLDVTGLGKGAAGQLAQTGLAAGSAAAQGFANPIADANLVYRLFKNFGIL
jgi:hypothetical protein